MDKLNKNLIKKVFVLNLGGIGDVLGFVPTLRSLHRGLPGANISTMVAEGRGGEDILENCPYVSKLITFDYSSSIIEKVRLIWKLRKEEFDVAIGSFPTGPKSAWFLWALGANYTIGFPSKSERFLFDVALKKEGKVKHFIEYNLTILEHFGLKKGNSRLEMWLKDSDKRFAQLFLEKYHIKKDDLSITVHPGSGGPHELLGNSKIWPAARFASLCDELIQKYQAKICLIGGSRELPLVKKINKQMRNKPITAVGKCTITQTAAIIKKANLHIGGDSGPMHVAVAVGTPVIALFGSTNPKIVGPRGDRNVVIQKDISCNPCYKHFKPSKIECSDPKCMKAIKVEDALKAVKKILHE